MQRKGLEVFGTAVARFEELTKQGRIHGHREYFSVTGADGGFMIVESAVSELLALSGEEDTLRLNGKAASIVRTSRCRCSRAEATRQIQQLVGNYVGGLQELGLYVTALPGSAALGLSAESP